MNKKLFLYFFILIGVFCLTIEKNFASPIIHKMNMQTEISVDNSKKTLSESEIIKRVSFKNKFQRTPEAQINSFIKKYNKYSEKNDFKKLKDMYSDKFVNNDGFDKHTIFKMMEAVANVYKNTTYCTEIKEIKINGKYAEVTIHEEANSQADNLAPKFNDTGIIVSKIDYTDYLVKEENNWKILSTNVLSEEVSMKYGEAKNMDVKINAPDFIGSGVPYEVSVYANNPDGSFALGSIVNEQIIFPQKDTVDVFRAIKNEKLSRILTSNKDNHNEYVTVSIALTRADVEPEAININMTGMALAMKRVNVIPFAQKKDSIDVSKK